MCPKLSGSLCRNYIGYFSTVLLAVVDANCKFMLVNTGLNRKEGDPGIFERFSLGVCSTVANFFRTLENECKGSADQYANKEYWRKPDSAVSVPVGC